MHIVIIASKKNGMVMSRSRFPGIMYAMFMAYRVTTLNLSRNVHPDRIKT